MISHRFLVRTKIITILLFCLAGCGVIPLSTSQNEPGESNQPTRSSSFQSNSKVPDNLFVGVAISGGGSRAANLGAAALFELEQLSILPNHVAAISAVSGGARAAAYYGLYADQKDMWNPDRVKSLLRVDYEWNWIIHGLMPWNFLRVWFTDFDRSDVMAGVYDRVLFDNKRFRDMPPHSPRIYLNGTHLGIGGDKFVFTDEAFKQIGSRLDTYPVSYAAMASEAFPAAFEAVTLTNYAKQNNYAHIFDGGTSDNLGIETLVESAVSLDRQKDSVARPSGCFLFVVDAHVFVKENQLTFTNERDPRRLIDYLIDTNAMSSIEVFTNKARTETLNSFGISYPNPHFYGEYKVGTTATGSPLTCGVWVLTFERLDQLAALGGPGSKLSQLSRVANAIETRLTLIGPDEYSARELQDILFEIAHILLWEDKQAFSFMCTWFKQHHVDLPHC